MKVGVIDDEAKVREGIVLKLQVLPHQLEVFNLGFGRQVVWKPYLQRRGH